MCKKLSVWDCCVVTQYFVDTPDRSGGPGCVHHCGRLLRWEHCYFLTTPQQLHDGYSGDTEPQSFTGLLCFAGCCSTTASGCDTDSPASMSDRPSVRHDAHHEGCVLVALTGTRLEYTRLGGAGLLPAHTELLQYTSGLSGYDALLSPAEP
jgi:hypothetical protein